VGSTYQRVKKASEAKKAKQEAEIAQRDKVPDPTPELQPLFAACNSRQPNPNPIHTGG